MRRFSFTLLATNGSAINWRVTVLVFEKKNIYKTMQGWKLSFIHFLTALINLSASVNKKLWPFPSEVFPSQFHVHFHNYFNGEIMHVITVKNWLWMSWSISLKPVTLISWTLLVCVALSKANSEIIKTFAQTFWDHNIRD